eukprot:Skav236473  [mRNA]  locus=scaffold1440:51794:55044:+ [translate_table: standard]
MLAEPPVQQPLASSSTTVPEMEDGKRLGGSIAGVGAVIRVVPIGCLLGAHSLLRLYVIHTPAPGALPEDPSLTMTLHTPPPMTLAEKVLQSESAFIPEATQGPRWSEIPASDKGRWPDDVPPASLAPQKLPNHVVERALARPGGQADAESLRQQLVDEVRRICVKGGGSVRATWLLRELPQDLPFFGER